jgi:DNA-binding LytR/AlgR family response regulator
MQAASPENAVVGRRLRALVVDDEAPALSELIWLLDQDPRIGTIHSAASGTEALRVLDTAAIDVVFCDIKMPGLDGLDLARVLAHFAERPQIVFVTAYEDHAVHAFDLRVTDYVLKPVRAERLAEAVRLVGDRIAGPVGVPDAQTGDDDPGDETIAVELGGVTRFVQRSHVTHVEAQGDYARLHTMTGSHLVRVPLSVLEERWAGAGFVRIHRSTLVAISHVDEIRIESGRCAVRLGDQLLQVSRRHTKDLRDRLVRAASLTRDRS